jgi:competence protein ComEC
LFYICGFNIAILSGMFATFFGRMLGPRLGALAAILGISGYTVLVGADAAVVRAAIMGGLALLAQQVGRRQAGLNSLGISAAAMSLFNPRLPWDVSFQLSFMATLGLVLYAEPFSLAFGQFFSRIFSPQSVSRLVGYSGEYLLFTLAAQLTTLPVSAYHFKQIAPVSLLANFLILPAQPAVMILGGLAVVVGMVFLSLGKILAVLAWPFAAFTIRVVELFAGFPSGIITLGSYSLVSVSLFYGVLMALTFGREQMSKLASAVRPGLVLAIFGALTIFVWQPAINQPDGKLHLTLLDVSSGAQSGDAILIRTPGGRNLLINGGPSTRKLSDSLGRRLPLMHRDLDFLLVGSTREHQVASLPELIRRYPPGEVIWAGEVEASRSAFHLSQQLVESGHQLTFADAGQLLDLGQGAHLHILSAGRRGAIYLVEWRNFRALLPMGITFKEIEDLRLGKDIGEVTALLLAENGYGPANPQEWIENLHPRVILLSIAPGDAFKLPSEETMQAVGGYSLMRTDRNGWIQMTTDGEQIWVEVEKLLDR